MLHIKQQHTGCIRIFCAETSGQLICQIILRQHDLCNLREIVWFILFHPKDLRSCKSRKRNIGSVLRKFILSYIII